jgi:hypothetical protein
MPLSSHSQSANQVTDQSILDNTAKSTLKQGKLGLTWFDVSVSWNIATGRGVTEQWCDTVEFWYRGLRSAIGGKLGFIATAAQLDVLGLA